MIIDALKWNEARQIWIIEVMKLKEKTTVDSISMFGSEYDMFIKYLINFQEYKFKQNAVKIERQK